MTRPDDDLPRPVPIDRRWQATEQDLELVTPPDADNEDDDQDAAGDGGAAE